MGIFGFFSKPDKDPLDAHLNEYHRQQQRPSPTPHQQRESRRRGGGTSSGSISTRSNPTSRPPSRNGGRRKPCHVHSSSNGSNKGQSAASIAAALAAQQTGPLPNFFSFEQGSERAQGRYQNESTPLLGRFRAMPGGPGRRRESDDHQGLLSAGWRGSVHVGYGALMAAAAEGGGEFDDSGSEDEDDSEGDGMLDSGFLGAGTIQGRTLTRRVMLKKFNRARRRLYYTWVHPKASVIRRVVEPWWSRWFVLVILPAFLAVAWCAIPFPKYPIPDYDDGRDSTAPPPTTPGEQPGRRTPGHGAARVQVNFWFFLFVYYSFYNLTALIWITKVFNLYSLNWWPKSLGFPLTVFTIGVISLAAPIPLYLIPELRWLTAHNTAWISWTFVIMAMPVTIAFCILMTNERHLKLRHSLSETQRIFTSSWWAGESGNNSRRESTRRAGLAGSFDTGGAELGFEEGLNRRPSVPVRIRRRWLPASFVRFVWFCLALLIGLLAYVIGEAYAEIYLRTLPHNNLETIVYVYGWVSTVYLLDGLTGWILGGNEGERVGSYPLSFIFKLYFMLTYQTYVRALYARLRSPQQFVMLQVLSSTTLIIVTPILMSRPVHWFLSITNLSGQSYGSYQKICIRNVFIRFVAENASMLAFLGSVVILHFGPNKDVYPYFAFDGEPDDTSDFDFGLTFYASSITWACELAAGFIVSGLIKLIYGVNVVTEGKLDFAVWPELLPTSVAVVLHVLQNMLFSIVRLQFH
ncbi:hypothetical protein QBC32DRAFT_376614 [Pseudoneurospora amorphoporcata]|uniref:Uncharacterized protein n=1 Tax=Pseudoneurospora amorphoporcata TaxID=241081 RepID=A0AAN6SER3_9PEZI|nr:hypothetical protein QBC32DRAFT_376614 [Pseudoneurospora amorphoporcata]